MNSLEMLESIKFKTFFYVMSEFAWKIESNIQTTSSLEIENEYVIKLAIRHKSTLAILGKMSVLFGSTCNCNFLKILHKLTFPYKSQYPRP
jgi:hypothetical protein